MATLESLLDGFRPDAEEDDFEFGLHMWADEMEQLCEQDRKILINKLFETGFSYARFPLERRDLVRTSLVEFYVGAGGKMPAELGIAEVSADLIFKHWARCLVPLRLNGEMQALLDIRCSIDWQLANFWSSASMLLMSVKHLHHKGDDVELVAHCLHSLGELILVSRRAEPNTEELKNESALVAKELIDYATINGKIGYAAKPALRQALLACDVMMHDDLPYEK